MQPHPAEEPPTIGVEEEFFLVHPGSRRLVAAGARVVARASAVVRGGVSGEFTEFQVEGRTPPCPGPQELHGELRRVRAALAAAARAEGLRLCASGTPVLAVAMTLIIRALVTTSASSVADGDPGPRVGAELLRAAYWRAARDGRPGQGLDTAPERGGERPGAGDVPGRLRLTGRRLADGLLPS